MKRRTDRKGAGTRAGFLEFRPGFVHGGHLPGNDNLLRRVVVDGFDQARDLRADPLDQGAVGFEHGRHGAFAERHSLLHVLTALAHESHGIGKVEGSGRDMR